MKEVMIPEIGKRNLHDECKANLKEVNV